MAAITFTKPAFLIFLIVIPILIIIHFIMLKRKRSHALIFANFEAIARVKGIDILSKNISMLILTAIITTLLIFSLAGITLHRTLESSSFSFVLAIDASRSMEAIDISPNRFEVAKETASIFVDRTAPGTEIGVISFSGNAFIETPLINDKTILKQIIKNIPLSSIGGTDLYEAVITAANLLDKEDAKAVILLSDGRINIGTIDDAVAYADKNDLVVHTVGLGTPEGGNTSFGFSKLDEDSLKGLSFNTEGKFFRAQNKEELQQSFSEIIDLRVKRVSFDLTPYTLLLALILLIAEYILGNTRYRIFP